MGSARQGCPETPCAVPVPIPTPSLSPSHPISSHLIWDQAEIRAFIGGRRLCPGGQGQAGQAPRVLGALRAPGVLGAVWALCRSRRGTCR